MSRALAAGALAPVVATLVLTPIGTARAAETVDCTSTQADAPAPSASTDPSLPLELLGIEEAHAWLAARREEPGQGVRVAVVDSGVAPRSAGPAVPVIAEKPPQISSRREVGEAHGTIVAGIVAGSPRTVEGVADTGTRGSPVGPAGSGDAEGAATRLVGIAPAAEVVDVRIYDSAEGGDDGDPVQPANLVAGLQWVADNARRLDIGVVNVSLAVGEYAPLKKVLKRLARADVVVVAASGNRPTLETDPLYEEFGPDPDEEGTAEAKPGEDAAGFVWPAAYDGVVAVSSTADGTGAGDATAQVLQSSDIDVAVPTVGLISYGLDGGSCGVPGVATSWAAAVVSGVVAMLRSHFPGETADQVVARLIATASASGGQRNKQTGAGVVQPLEALTRPLRPREDGTLVAASVEDRSVERATAPPPEADLLAGARDRSVWWGLVGGGALLLALVLRPVLARRRR
ncbi:S8 family serine peptidase [Nocardioides abyssi]|uniref:S8 family serine peptidase n=1 Tax=Nocardioides abyssi TaxID=3058370 RepID=A0ABT8ETB2_9ACTN|nr:S8 family serine peptidase [Nocardioides abyssi]MDN4161378.1 S8 family serine peptidase [Nocardioides abyssi]